MSAPKAWTVLRDWWAPALIFGTMTGGTFFGCRMISDSTSTPHHCALTCSPDGYASCQRGKPIVCKGANSSTRVVPWDKPGEPKRSRYIRREGQ